MFKQIFIEERIKDSHRVSSILQKLNRYSPRVTYIDHVSNYFGQFKKPYLQKRTNLNLYLGKKDGTLVKKAPNAYGTKDEEHYYFVYQYNCIYECQYCYLQGHFKSPDLVWFLNFEDIALEIQRTVHEHLKTSSNKIWFHAGEFSDSLALSHFTEEWPFFFDLFSKLPQEANLELRTKSANSKVIKDLPPQKNILITFSLSPEEQIQQYDLKTASLKARLASIKELLQNNHRVGIHLDPLIYSHNFEEEIEKLLSTIDEEISLSKLSLISLGVVRFTKDVYRQFQQNYPESTILAAHFKMAPDGLYRNHRLVRENLFYLTKKQLYKMGVNEKNIYLCME